MPLDEVALSLAALECGHGAVLCDDPAAVAARAGETGRRLIRDADGAYGLALDETGIAGDDVVFAPVELSEHRLATLGVLLLLITAERPLPAAGTGRVPVQAVAAALEKRNRDATTSLVSSLRSLDRLGLVRFDIDAQHVVVGSALAAQPESFFGAISAEREQMEAADA
jgi:hypothetical protein